MDRDREWFFATGTRLDDCFQEQLLVHTNSVWVKRVVMEKLEEIRRNPVSPNPYMLDREPVHFVTTGRFVTAEISVPPLLIVYSLDHVHRLIFLVHICHATDVDTSDRTDEPPWPEMSRREYSDRPPRELFSRTLRRILEYAVRLQRH